MLLCTLCARTSIGTRGHWNARQDGANANLVTPFTAQ
jgi:hypothetical protein